MTRGGGRCNPRGFTLLETLIAMAIVAILASLAVPGYQDVIRKTRRADAQLALLQIQVLQERHYASRFRYAETLETAGPDSLAHPAQTPAGDYALSVETSDDGQHYVAYARAIAGGHQAGDRDCQQLAIDALGNTRSAATDGIWRSGTRPCWN